MQGVMIMNASSCQYAIILENNAFDGINVTEIKKKEPKYGKYVLQY